VKFHASLYRRAISSVVNLLALPDVSFHSNYIFPSSSRFSITTPLTVSRFYLSRSDNKQVPAVVFRGMPRCNQGFDSRTLAVHDRGLSVNHPPSPPSGALGNRVECIDLSFKRARKKKTGNRTRETRATT